MVIGRGLRYGLAMTDTATFEYILIGPDGQVVRGQHPLKPSAVTVELEFPDREGPFPLIARYRRTDHKIEGRIRFDWIESERVDNGMIYRLASADGLGLHGLVNDPD